MSNVKMTIPLSVLLLPLAVFLLMFFVFSLINLVHMIRFASFDVAGFGVTFIFFAVSTLLLWYSYQLLNPINWTEPINFSFNIFTQLPQ